MRYQLNQEPIIEGKAQKNQEAEQYQKFQNIVVVDIER